MRAKVYLETTIASYLTARPSRDLVVAAHQELTLEWWNQNRGRFDLYEEARELARQFRRFHVAIATVQGMDDLLTWNCRHIANAEIIGRLAALCDELGLEIPTICTPELMGH